MPAQQFLDLRRDDVVAAGAVVEDPEFVLHFARTINRNRHADLVLGEELDNFRLQQRRVRRQAEIDLFAELGRAPARVGDGLLQAPGNSAAFRHRRRSGARSVRRLSFSMNSTLSRAVSSLMNFGCLPFSVSTILSSPYS